MLFEEQINEPLVIDVARFERQQTLEKFFVAIQEADTAHVELLSLIHINVEVGQLLLVIKPGARDAHEIEVADLSIGRAEVIPSRSFRG